MILWPYYRETFVLAHSAMEARRLLSANVRGGFRILNRETAVNDAPFKGYIGEHEFAITPAVRTAPAFTPYIYGRIEATSKGCIIWVEYRLLVETRMFLFLWVVICAGLVFFFLFAYKARLQAVTAAVFGLANYLIALVAFRLNLKRSRRELNRIFNNAPV